MAINAGTILAYLDLDTSKFGNAMQTAQSQMSDFAQSGGGLSGMLDGVGAAATTVGHALTLGISAPLVGVGAKAVSMGMDFDAQMSRVKAISGATADEFETLRAKASRWARTAYSARRTQRRRLSTWAWQAGKPIR